MADTATSTKQQDHSADDERREEREAMDRYTDRADEGRREVRDRARQEMGHFSNASRDAVRSFVRANNSLIGLMLPPAVTRPGEAFRTWFDLMGESFNITRAFVDETVQANRENLRRLDREADRDERVANRSEYGYYEEDNEFENGDLDDERRALQRERRQSSGSSRQSGGSSAQRRSA